MALVTGADVTRQDDAYPAEYLLGLGSTRPRHQPAVVLVRHRAGRLKGPARRQLRVPTAIRRHDKLDG